jgi:hypothetical protein
VKEEAKKPEKKTRSQASKEYRERKRRKACANPFGNLITQIHGEL